MRLFIAIGGLVVALLVAALVAPFFIDWSSWRTAFEAEASRLLGQKVQVRGEAHARLLPFPSLTFTDVVVGEPGHGEASMTLGSFRMDAELAPYISGEIRIFRMELGRPHLTVPYGAGSRPPQLGHGFGSGGAHVVLENVVITDGMLSLNNGSNGQRREFGDIDASFSASTLRGPFRGGGTLTNRGETLDFSLSSGTIEEGGHWPFRLTVVSPRLASSIALDGATQLGDGTPDFAGAVEVASPVAGMEPVAGMPPMRITAQVTSADGGADFQKIRVEAGAGESPYVLTGAGTMASGPIPHFNLTLDGEQIDIDRLTLETLAKEDGVTLADRIEAVRRTLRAIPALPVAGEVALNLPVFTIGDTTVRGLRMVASPNMDGWALRQLNAELPGRTLLEASGLLAVGDTLAFKGALLLASRQPAGFVSWLGGAGSERLSTLQRAGFSADVDLSASRQAFDNLEADVEGQTLRGRLERSTKGAQRSIAADLSGDDVDIENFLAFAQLLTGEQMLASQVDSLDLRLSAGPLRFDGMVAEAGEVDLTYGDDLLDLRNLALTGFAGGDLEARGTVGRPGNGLAPDLVFEANIAEPAQLAHLMRRAAEGLAPNLVSRVAQMVERSGTVAGSGRLAPAETDGQLVLSFNGTAGPTEISTSMVLPATGAFAEGGPLDLTLLLASDSPAGMLRQLGAGGLDLGVPSPLEIRLRLAGPANAATTSLGAHAPGLDVAMEGETAWTAAGLARADGTASLEAADASVWLSALGIAAGQGIDALPMAGTAQVSWLPEGWKADRVSGTIADLTIESAELAQAGAAPLSGTAAVSSLSVPWLVTTVLGAEPERNPADGTWPNAPFGGAFTAQLPPFTLAMTAGTVLLHDDAALQDAQFSLAGTPDGLSLSGFSATAAGGLLTGNASLANTGGFARAHLDLALADATIPSGALPLGGQAAGNLVVDAAGQSFREFFASVDGTGTLRLQDTVLPGVSLPPLPSILDGADRAGFEATAETVSALMVTLPAEAARLDTVEMPIAIALGTARFGPFTAPYADGALTGQGAFSLLTGTGDMQATYLYQPGEDDRLDDTTPAVTYGARLPEASSFTLTGAGALTSYLSIRAYRAEQARLQTVRDDLQETLRLRREARYFAGLERQREMRAAEAAAQAEAAARAAAAAAAAEEERRRAAEAQRAAEQQPVLPNLPVPELRVPPAAQVPPQTPGQPAAPGMVAPPFKYDLSPARPPLADLPGVNPNLQ